MTVRMLFFSYKTERTKQKTKSDQINRNSKKITTNNIEFI